MRKTIVAAIIAAVSAVLGFWGYRLSTGRQPVEIREVGRADRAAGTLAGAAPSAEASSLASAVPETLPEFTLPDRDGQPRKLSHWAGRPLLINFWATWCEPCRREIPLLKSLRSERSAARLEIVGIAIDTRDPVLSYAQQAGIDYPLLIGEQEGYESAAAFGVPGVLPFTVFADSRGRVVTLKIGELHRDEAEFILDQLQGLEAGTIELADAKARIAARLRELGAARTPS